MILKYHKTENVKDKIDFCNQVYFTARDKEFELYLLKINRFNYFSFGRKRNSKFGKIYGLLKFNFKLHNYKKGISNETFI